MLGLPGPTRVFQGLSGPPWASPGLFGPLWASLAKFDASERLYRKGGKKGCQRSAKPPKGGILGGCWPHRPRVGKKKPSGHKQNYKNQHDNTPILHSCHPPSTHSLGMVRGGLAAEDCSGLRPRRRSNTLNSGARRRDVDRRAPSALAEMPLGRRARPRQCKVRVEPHRLSRPRFPLMYDSTKKDPKAKSACQRAFENQRARFPKRDPLWSSTGVPVSCFGSTKVTGFRSLLEIPLEGASSHNRDPRLSIQGAT